MKKKTFFLSACLGLATAVIAQEPATQTPNKEVPQPAQEQLIYINWKDEKLVDIVNRLAAQRQINILLPFDQKRLADTTVTYKIPYKIALSRAWQMLVSILEIAGYAVVNNDTVYNIVTKNTVSQRPTPFYIDSTNDFLPNGNEIIRYLYYFQNLHLKDKGTKDNLGKILADLLPGDNNDPSQQNFSLDDGFNTLLITATSGVVKSIMPIIRELDQNGFREEVEVVPLFYTTAHELVDILKQLIPQDKDGSDAFRFPPMVANNAKTSHSYFSSSTRVVSIDQTNSVAIFGLHESVERVKKVIKNHLDTRLEADRTILHVKKLRYLKAEDLADTLQKLVDQKGDDQAQSTGVSSLNKLLGNVIITAEKEQATQQAQDGQQQPADTISAEGVGVKSDQEQTMQGPTIGGNNLIVAATSRDWKILEHIIDALDNEPWQIALEVLLVDLTVDNTNKLGAQIRRVMNDNKVTGLHNEKWQSAMLAAPILDYIDPGPPYGNTNINTKTGLESDLMSNQPPATSTGTATNIAAAQDAGSTVFTFDDENGISLVLSMLQDFEDTRIVAKPFLIAKNNQTATILSQELRYVQGKADAASMGGTVVKKWEAMVAAVMVKITPRVSTPPDNINLEIKIDVNEFLETTVVGKRSVLTNANVGHKDVLVLGGISKATIGSSLKTVPILGDIPIIGNLFKFRSYDNNQRNLLIFIAPRRIPPASISQGTDSFTKKHLNRIADLVEKGDENFSSLRDPIANFLFHPDNGRQLAKQIRDYQGLWSQQLTNEKKAHVPMPKLAEPGANKNPVAPQEKTLKKEHHKHKNGTSKTKHGKQEKKKAPTPATANDKLKNLLSTQSNPFKPLAPLEAH